MMIRHIYVDLDLRRTSVDLGQKIKGQIWTLNFFTVSAPQLHLLLAYNNDTSQMYSWGQKIKGQGHIWSLHFVSFPHDKSIYFWHTIMILHRCIDHDLRRTSLDFGSIG